MERPTPEPAPWQPVRQRAHGPRLFLFLGLAAVIAFATLWAFSKLATNNPEKLNLGGDRKFVVRNIAGTAKTIDSGGPVLLPALAPSKVDLFLQHLGDGRFVAFSALAPGKGRECALSWSPTERLFVDPCSSATFPSDGTGLTAYFVETDKDLDIIRVDPLRPLN